jgi:putative transposase
MGGRGSACDNAVCEAFFKTLKSELVDRRSWPAKAELRSAVFDYIECFYNQQRPTRRSATWRLPTTRESMKNEEQPNQPVSTEAGEIPAA